LLWDSAAANKFSNTVVTRHTVGVVEVGFGLSGHSRGSVLKVCGPSVLFCLVGRANESILHQEEEEFNPNQSYQRLQPSSSPGSPRQVEPMSKGNNDIDLSWES